MYVMLVSLKYSLIWKRTGSNACVGDADYLVLVKTYSRQVGDLSHFALHVNPTVDIAESPWRMVKSTETSWIDFASPSAQQTEL